jgi:hypothetical protein
MPGLDRPRAEAAKYPDLYFIHFLETVIGPRQAGPGNALVTYSVSNGPQSSQTLSVRMNQLDSVVAEQIGPQQQQHWDRSITMSIQSNIFRGMRCRVCLTLGFELHLKMSSETSSLGCYHTLSDR